MKEENCIISLSKSYIVSLSLSQLSYDVHTVQVAVCAFFLFISFFLPTFIYAKKERNTFIYANEYTYIEYIDSFTWVTVARLTC